MSVEATLKQTVYRAKRATVLRGNTKLADQLDHDAGLEPGEATRQQALRAVRHAKFAMTHTRFYRDLYSSAGFSESDLDDPEAFAELPMVTKADVRADPAAFLSTEANDRTSKKSVTGGSTGEPLTMYRDLRFPARALEWRLMSWWGVSPADDWAVVYRHVRGVGESRRNRLFWWPSRRFQLDAMDMNADSVRRFMAQWARIKPGVLISYVGAAAELATMINDGVADPPAPPKAIGVTAAPLSVNQRALIESVFGAPVYDHYRSAEVPWIAGECRRQDGLHVFADLRKVEIVDDAGRPVPDGTTGEVVASDLTNRVFPLLRYRIGDRTAYRTSLCSCGVTLPLIEPVSGRTTEVLHLPGVLSVAGEGLSQLFKLAPEAVRQFQIHQRADFSIDLRVVRGPAPDADRAIALTVERLNGIVHDSVPVRLEVVTSIPHDGGKVRYLISDLTRRSS